MDLRLSDVVTNLVIHAPVTAAINSSLGSAVDFSGATWDIAIIVAT